jgi:molecular chaperone GrpE
MNDTTKQNTDNAEQVEEQTVTQTDDSQTPDPVTDLEQRVKSLEDQLKRALADYQNLEKRVAEGRSELARWATSEVVQKILPVMDHLDKALSGMSDEEKKSGWAKGVQMAVAELKNVLKSEGLDEIAVDGQFDPTLHEAVDMREGEDNMILEVVEKGYSSNGKILRPARVIVGKGGQK